MYWGVATLIVGASLFRNDFSSLATKEHLSYSIPSFVRQGEELKGIPEPLILQENSLIAISSPQKMNLKTIGVLTGQEMAQDPENKIIHYIVEGGDTISSIAANFNVSLNTILWANDLSSFAKLKEGQELIILPVSGVMHLVKSGETISEIANSYKIKSGEILSFNNIGAEEKIFVGDILIIPGGQKLPKKIAPKSLPPSLPNSYFICPVSGCRITQGLHWHNAVDFSTGECNSPVFASAGGTIQRTGYQKIAGNYIRILHPSGIVTFYGHLSKIIVSVGQQVSQGEIIGYIGHTGYTIPRGELGCHLHFDVRGAKNPFNN